MSANEYEPSAEQVEAMERDIRRLTGVPYNLGQTMIVAILRRQHERESGLLKALRNIADGDTYYGRTTAAMALAAHAKLDAKPEPTLLEAAKAVINNSAAPFAAFDALKAAVEREERGKQSLTSTQ